MPCTEWRAWEKKVTLGREPSEVWGALSHGGSIILGASAPKTKSAFQVCVYVCVFVCLCVCLCVFVCLCVCVCQRKERRYVRMS